MVSLTKIALGLGAVTSLAVLGGCSDAGRNIVDPPPPGTDTALVSDPVRGPTAGLTVRQGNVAASAATQAALETEIAYVSLPPGMVPNGRTATIRNPRIGNSAEVRLVDGGFDPVPMTGRAGDEIEVVVTNAANAPVYAASIKVPVRRAPTVIRTVPAKGKADVPRNASIVVVFSEPVDGATLTATSIRLVRGTTPIAGAVRFLDPTLDASHVSVEFVPDAPLAVGAEYQLVVTTQVRDLTGEVLPAQVTTSFSTGQSLTGSPASIRVLPDTLLQIVAGTSYQLTATVQDAGGNMLTDQPVTWSVTPLFSSDPNGLTVSPTGLLTALGLGVYHVTASVGEVSTRLTAYVTTGPPASLTLSPTPATVASGDTIILTATVRDAGGRTIAYPAVTWASNTPAVATVASDDGSGQTAFGTVTGVSQGSVTITATSGSAQGTATVTVGPARTLASVAVTPAQPTVIVQMTTQLSATLLDPNGKLIYNRPVTWTSDNPAVATVDAKGLVTGVSVGSARVTATSGSVSGSSAITVATLTFASVSAGGEHTCGLTTSGVAYCWGANWSGQLGNGAAPSRSLIPVPVTGGLTFTALSAGYEYTCGVTTTGAAYCWGRNDEGQLGNGSSGHYGAFSSAPVAVSGGLIFTTVSVASGHTCGLTTASVTYCWGRNSSGELGTGTTTGPESCYDSGDYAHPCSTVPVQVVLPGGLTLSALSAGAISTCGLTASGAAFCWGRGPLGDGSTNSSPVPVPVSGGLTFISVSGGSGRTCGLTATGAAHCWGYNSAGELGDGTTTTRLSSTPVSGSLTWATLGVGGNHTCAVTTTGAAYCWGDNGYGQLGTGSAAGPEQCVLGDPPTNFAESCSRTPVAVTGALRFSTVSASGSGNGYTCAVTTDGIAYCWGNNEFGQLGNGTTTNSSWPVKVAGQP